MRVGISASLAQGGRSGIGQYVLQLLGGLLHVCPNHEYVVFARQDDWPLFSFAREAVRLEPIAGWRPLPPDDVRWHHLTLPRLTRELRLDVLHIPTQRRMLWRKPCAVVTTVHDVGPFRSPRSPQSRGSCPNTIFRALARRQDALIALSEAAKTELAALCGTPPERITAISPGVDARRFDPLRRADGARTLMSRHGLHPPFFLCVGRLEAGTHNQLRVVEAFTRFKMRTPSPWQLVLVGDEGGRPGEIRAHVERSPYAADIRVVGFVPAEQLPDWYGAAGGVLCVRQRDGYGHTALEAMAAGAPLITSDTPTMRALCGEAALYCDPDNVAGLEERLMALATDEARRRQLSAAGPRRAATLTWAQAAQATAEVYGRAQRHFEAALDLPAAVTDTAAVS